MCVNGEEAKPVCQRGSWALTHFGLGCHCAFPVREFSSLIMGSQPAVAMLVFRAVLRSQESLHWHS